MRINVTLLLLITVLAFLLRMSGLTWGQGYTYHAIGDQIEAYRSALNYMHGEEKAQYIGQPNFKEGHVPGPLWAMLWSLPLRFGGSANDVAWIVLLLNTSVIPLIYLLAHRVCGAKYALWAALFYATAPWTVYYSIGPSNHLMMAFPSVLLCLALWDVSQRPRSPHIFWVCLIMAAMPQFHMSSVFVFPAAFLVLVLSPALISKKWLAAGLTVVVLMYLPYIRGEMTSHWENTRAMLTGESRLSPGALKLLTIPVNVLSNLVSRWTGYKLLVDYRMFGDAAFGSFFVLALFNLISIGLALLFLGDFIREFFRTMRGRWRSPREVFKTSPSVVFIGILLFVPLVFFMFTGHGYSTRYAIALFPLLFLLPGLFVVNQNVSKPWRKVLLGCIALTVLFNVALSPLFFCYQGRQIETGDHFIPSFRKMDNVYGFLRRHAGKGARIRIDDHDYHVPPSVETRPGAGTLVDYVTMREELDHPVAKDALTRVYKLMPASEVSESDRRVVYRGSGIVLIAESGTRSASER